MNNIRVISDIHGKYKEYLEIVAGCEYSVQLGDLGYNNKFVEQNVDYSKHKFFPGNHDNHETDYSLKNCLGRFGSYVLNNVNFFFLAGGYSINQKSLTLGIDYFDNEELSHRESYDCLNAYQREKPSILITHEPPRFLVPEFSDPEALRHFNLPDNFESYTSLLINELYEIHRPKIHIYGHFHRSWRKHINGTQFILLNELEYYDLKV